VASPPRRRPVLTGAPSVAAALLIAAGGAAAAPGPPLVVVGPAPDWTVRHVPDVARSSEGVDVSEGVHHLLLDTQVNGTVRPLEVYSHRAWRVLGETGVQNGSTLRIEFDPSFERLVLHEVVVHREGRRLPRLELDAVRLIQREERLDAQIYDGTLTALYFVEGVHDGDVVEHAYTTVGLNPTFDGRWAEGFDVRWSVPLDEQHHRILWPAGRALRWRGHGTDLSPRIERRGPVQVLTWEQRLVEPLRVEADVPSWLDVWPWVQVTEYESWAEVAEWGLRLFEPAEGLPAELIVRAGAWREERPTDAELARRALRLVQDEVRYLGIEFGPNAYQPSEPPTVYARRFGDCKDKSVLLVQLLRQLGLDARPALVDTVSGRLLPGRLPTPLAFDHAVVCLRLDGEVHWLDPTRIHERGPLGRLSVPEWSWALVLEPGAESLTEVRDRDHGRTLIEERYEAGDDREPVLFRVRTTFEGSDADAVREYLAEQSREDVLHAYRDYYAALWGEIEAVRPVEVVDDPERNVLVTEERYRIADFWSAPADGRGREAEVWSLLLDDELGVPGAVQRDSPLAVSHPVRMEQRTEVLLPEGWAPEIEDVHVRDPAFRFDYTARNRPDGVFEVVHVYETLADSVAAERVPEYRAAVERARGTLGLTFTTTVSDGGFTAHDVEWPLLLMVSVALAAGLSLALVLHASWGSRGDGTAPRPGGAGLVLLTLAVLASPLRGLLALGALAWLFVRSEWRATLDPTSSGWHPLNEGFHLVGLLGSAVLVGWSALLVLQWLGRRRRAPAILLGFLAACFALSAVREALLAAMDPGPGAALGLGLRLVAEALVYGIVAAWVVTSERVRETFVR
jgi:hypothetical protein